MKIAIAGAGICGLTSALALHAAGHQVTVYESADEFRPLGAGVSLLPSGVSVLNRLGLLESLREVAVPFKESSLFNQFGQRLYTEPADQRYPQFLIHRADLHRVLHGGFTDRVGSGNLLMGHAVQGVRESGDGVRVQWRFAQGSETAESDSTYDVVVAADGIHSNVRKQFYPDEGEPRFFGVNMWRGLSESKPFLSGGTHTRIGTLDVGKLVAYPVRNLNNSEGTQLINWVAEIRSTDGVPVSWGGPGDSERFTRAYSDWHFDWLDVPDLLARAESILEWPMSDRDPVDRWAFGRTILVGDAAHPMLPRGSNGAMQAMLDAEHLATVLARSRGAVESLRQFEAERLPIANAVVLTNRTTPPDHLIEVVNERSGNKPFEDIDSVISQAELKDLFDSYKRTARYDGDSLTA